MAKLDKILLKIDGVKKVETFSKTHDKIYKILVIFKGVSQSFAVLIALMGIALISKQMRIWLYEHRRRIEVMTDLGAPYWLKSAMLYKLAIIDSFVATAITCAFYLALPHVSALKDAFVGVGFELPHFDFANESALLFGASIAVSIVAVSLVMMQSREK